MTKVRALVGLLLGLMLLAACTPPTPTPRPAPTAIPTAVRRPTVIITVPPPPTATIPPTATVPYDIGTFQGMWQITLVYTLRDNPLVPTLRYTGTAALNIDGGGNILGTIDFYGVAEGLFCAVQVIDPLPLSAKISGKLYAPEKPTSPTDVLADLTLTPSKPGQATSFKIICPEFKNIYDLTQPMFWPALTAVNALDFTIPFRPGYRQSVTTDLNGPTAGGLRGLLISEVLSLSR